MQERLQAALEQMPAAVIIANAPNGRVMHANRRAAELFGQPYPPPFLNLDWSAAVLAFRGWHTDGRSYAPNEWPLAKALQQGITTDQLVEVAVGNGERRVLAVGAAPVRDENGDVIAAVSAFWDVSQIKSTEKALVESERRLRLIVENSPDFAILMPDLAGNVTAWNIGAEQVLGWTEAEMLGQPGARIFVQADRDAGVPESEMRSALENGRAMDERWHVRKDGTAVWANGVMSVARDEAGSVKGFVKILRDNTEQKEAEDKFYAATLTAKEAKATAEAANRAKDDFISMITISAGKLRLDMRPTRLAEAVQSSVEAVRPVAVRKGVRLTFTSLAEVGIVRADPDRIQQVAWNLLSNAVKFTPSGGKVSVEIEREDANVAIRICDTGIGIRSDLLPHIFDRFLQGDTGTSREHGGLGLGLAIAKQLVELHGGKILAKSEGQGRGACFSVLLPWQADIATVEEPAMSVALHSNLLGVRVLLVEDEPNTREGTAVLLETHGATVQAVESVVAAREACTLQRPDILVSDIGLPGEDGYSLIRQIRATESEQKLPHLPAIALTAFARSADRQHAAAAGYDAHLAKPVDPDDLVREIARVAASRAE